MDLKSVPSKIIESAPVGPLSAYVESYIALVNDQGFAPRSVYEQRLGTPPSKLTLAELNAPFLVEFLDDLEAARSNDVRSRNARLAALRSFYHYAALEAPRQSTHT